jgi:hypothetical protein
VGIFKGLKANDCQALTGGFHASLLLSTAGCGWDISFARRERSMQSRVGKILAPVACLLPFGASAQSPAYNVERGIVSMDRFWKSCEKRKSSEIDGVWCLAFIVGNIDAAITISQAVKGPSFCFTADNFDQMVDRIITFVPSQIRGSQAAAPHLQNAISDALKCAN